MATEHQHQQHHHLSANAGTPLAVQSLSFSIDNNNDNNNNEIFAAHHRHNRSRSSKSLPHSPLPATSTTSTTTSNNTPFLPPINTQPKVSIDHGLGNHDYGHTPRPQQRHSPTHKHHQRQASIVSSHTPSNIHVKQTTTTTTTKRVIANTNHNSSSSSNDPEKYKDLNVTSVRSSPGITEVADNDNNSNSNSTSNSNTKSSKNVDNPVDKIKVAQRKKQMDSSPYRRDKEALTPAALSDDAITPTPGGRNPKSGAPAFIYNAHSAPPALQQQHQHQHQRGALVNESSNAATAKIDMPIRIQAPSNFCAPFRIEPATTEYERLFNFLKAQQSCTISPQQQQHQYLHHHQQQQHHSNNKISPKKSRSAGNVGGGSSVVGSASAGGGGGGGGCAGKNARINPDLLRDLSMRAFACQRAGKRKEESIAYYNMGILYDNMGDYEKAIQYYSNFCSISVELGDQLSHGLGLNHIGVDYQLLYADLANSSSSSSSFGAAGESGQHAGLGGGSGGAGATKDDLKSLLNLALQYHNKHMEIADVHGKAVALTNIGIAYSSMGENEAAVTSHSRALKYAAESRDTTVEAIATGNLGLCLIKSNRLEQAKDVLLGGLDLLSIPRGVQHQTIACIMLLLMGHVLGRQEDHAEACIYYEKAFAASRLCGIRELGDIARVNLGVARGNVAYKNKLMSVARSVRKETMTVDQILKADEEDDMDILEYQARTSFL